MQISINKKFSSFNFNFVICKGSWLLDLFFIYNIIKMILINDNNRVYLI